MQLANTFPHNIRKEKEVIPLFMTECGYFEEHFEDKEGIGNLQPSVVYR